MSVALFVLDVEGVAGVIGGEQSLRRLDIPLAVHSLPFLSALAEHPLPLLTGLFSQTFDLDWCQPQLCFVDYDHIAPACLPGVAFSPGMLEVVIIRDVVGRKEVLVAFS